jgi:hypothetical protein
MVAIVRASTQEDASNANQHAVIMDPMDKNFDLEAFLTKVAADNA